MTSNNTQNGRITSTPQISKMGYMKMYEEYGPPECCFTCSHFDNPFCNHFQSDVPANFANSMNKCPDYKSDIPF